MVDWAKKHRRSALHAALEWNNSKAGHAHRVWQVRQLISLHVVNETGQRQLVSLSIDRTAEHGGYRDINAVVRAKKLRAVLLADALGELQRVRDRYETVRELSRVWAEVDRVKKRKEVRKLKAAA